MIDSPSSEYDSTHHTALDIYAAARNQRFGQRPSHGGLPHRKNALQKNKIVNGRHIGHTGCARMNTTIAFWSANISPNWTMPPSLLNTWISNVVSNAFVSIVDGFRSVDMMVGWDHDGNYVGTWSAWRREHCLWHHSVNLLLLVRTPLSRFALYNSSSSIVRDFQKWSLICVLFSAAERIHIPTQNCHDYTTPSANYHVAVCAWYRRNLFHAQSIWGFRSSKGRGNPRLVAECHSKTWLSSIICRCRRIPSPFR